MVSSFIGGVLGTMAAAFVWERPGWVGVSVLGAQRPLRQKAAESEAADRVDEAGLGGIGLNLIQGARMVGADKRVGIDLNPAREAMERKFGMTHFLDPKDTPDLVGTILERRGCLQLRMHRQHDHDAPGAGVLPQRDGGILAGG